MGNDITTLFPDRSSIADVVSGAGHYQILFCRGFEQLDALMERRHDAFKAFPAHIPTFVRRELSAPNANIYHAALIQFERLTRHLLDAVTLDPSDCSINNPFYTTGQRNGESPPSLATEISIPALSLIPSLAQIRSQPTLLPYQPVFSQWMKEFTDRNVFMYELLNPELYRFARHTAEASQTFATLNRSIAAVTQTLGSHLGNLNETLTHHPELIAHLTPFYEEQDIRSEFNRVKNDHIASHKLLCETYNQLQELKQEKFKEWNLMVWDGVVQVYGGSVLELGAEANIYYYPTCEKIGRFMLGLEFFEHILERHPLNAPKPTGGNLVEEP